MARPLVMCAVVMLAMAFLALASSKPVMVCYYGSWAVYRNGEGRFGVEDILPDVCSHLVYAFVGLSDDGTVRIMDPYLELPDDGGKDNLRKFNSLKSGHPELKTLIAIGGWNENSARYSVMANDPSLRARFVASARDTVLKYGFDGLDMDWEFPGRRDSVHGKADIHNFSQLLRELRVEFDKHGLLLTAAVAAVGEKAAQSYDISAIAESLDLINLMTYDLNGSWDAHTGHNSPLYKGTGDENLADQDAFTVDAAVQYWLSQGCPAHKLVLGLPLYGRTFTLADPNQAGVRAAATGAGSAGPYTAQAGLVGYNELCVQLQTGEWQVHYDNKAMVPYAVKGREWVSFDNAESLGVKAQYALDRWLGGVMFWSIETDDFHGKCHQESSHLLRSVARTLGRGGGDSGGDVTASTPVPAPTPTTSVTSSPADSSTAATAAPGGAVCSAEGFVRDPTDCAIFYSCVWSADGSWSAVQFRCPGSLVWDATLVTCNHADSVDCSS